MKTKNIKVGDKYKCVKPLISFEKGKEYEINNIKDDVIYLTDDKGLYNGFYDVTNISKYFRPVSQKYMCFMGKVDRYKYGTAVEDEDCLFLSDETHSGGFHIGRNYNLITIKACEGYKLITSEDFMQKFPPPNKEVEFVKGEEYESDMVSGRIVMCTDGEQTRTTFPGVIISKDKTWGKGHYCEEWCKISFKN